MAMVELADRRVDLDLRLARDAAGLAHHPGRDLGAVAVEQLGGLRRIATRARSSAVAAHSRWARAADCAARATEAAFATPAVPSTSPVAGSVVSIVSGASTQPSLKILPVQSLLVEEVPDGLLDACS